MLYIEVCNNTPVGGVAQWLVYLGLWRANFSCPKPNLWLLDRFSWPLCA